MIKGLIAFSALMIGTLITMGSVQSMAEEKCYGPAFPELPLCSIVQDLK